MGEKLIDVQRPTKKQQQPPTLYIRHDTGIPKAKNVEVPDWLDTGEIKMF